MVHHGHIRCGHTECHASQLPIQLRDDLSNSLGSSPSSSPVLARGSVNCLLCGCSSVDSSHQTLQYAVVVVDNLCQGGETVGGTGSIRDNLHVGRVGALINSHDKHRSIGRRSRDDHFLSSSLVMGRGFLQGGEDTSRLHHILCSCRSPVDGSRVSLVEDSDGLPVNDQLVPVDLDLTLVLSMCGVVLEHVNHIVQGNEGVVDCHHGGSLLQGGPENQTTNTAKSVDTNVRHAGWAG